MKLTPRQEDVLVVVAHTGPVSVPEISYHLPIGDNAARAAMGALFRKGAIDVAGWSGRARTYAVTKRGASALPQEEQD